LDYNKFCILGEMAGPNEIGQNLFVGAPGMTIEREVTIEVGLDPLDTYQDGVNMVEDGSLIPGNPSLDVTVDRLIKSAALAAGVWRETNRPIPVRFSAGEESARNPDRTAARMSYCVSMMQGARAQVARFQRVFRPNDSAILRARLREQQWKILAENYGYEEDELGNAKGTVNAGVGSPAANIQPSIPSGAGLN
jgi:hypothetical protein